MKLSRKSLMFFIVLSAAVLILTGCPKDSSDSVEQLSPDDLNTSVRGDEVITGQPTTKTWGDQGDIDSRASTGEIAKTGGNELLTVYFDFDKYNLRSDTIEILRGNIQFLKNNSTTRIIIEGHCDERGTNEYNMALGSRRANSCRQYLLANGIAASRITITSFGEERAVDPGHHEAAWAKNRRAEFIVVSR